MQSSVAVGLSPRAAFAHRFGDPVNEPAGPSMRKMLRTAREALHNVRKHANAQHVSVTVREVDDHLVLEVADDGRGSDLDERAEQRSRGHLGLQILDDIAVDAGATLRIISKPDAGTCVRLEMASQR